jgi:DNA-binding CsgD family transcriptional regulator
MAPADRTLALPDDPEPRAVKGPRSVTLPLAPPSSDLDAYTFSADADEYLVFSFCAEADGSGAATGSLTDAEREVLGQVLGGRSNVDIAHARRTSPRTIANQITAIYRKLGVTSRRELFALRSREAIDRT